MNSQIRIMIVEDHFVVRVGLKAIINSQPDMTTVAEAGNGRQAVEAYEQHRPDVTLMDLRLPGQGGIDAIGAIIAKYPKARVIVLSTYGGDENIFRAFQAGARAYFLKDVKGQDLVQAIRAVHAGQRPLPPEIADRLLERVPRRAGRTKKSRRGFRSAKERFACTPVIFSRSWAAAIARRRFPKRSAAALSTWSDRRSLQRDGSYHRL